MDKPTRDLAVLLEVLSHQVEAGHELAPATLATLDDELARDEDLREALAMELEGLEDDEMPIPEWHRLVLERRMRDVEDGLVETVPAEDVLKELHRKLEEPMLIEAVHEAAGWTFRLEPVSRERVARVSKPLPCTCVRVECSTELDDATTLGLVGDAVGEILSGISAKALGELGLVRFVDEHGAHVRRRTPRP